MFLSDLSIKRPVLATMLVVLTTDAVADSAGI